MENPRECALDVLIKVDKKEELSHIAISNVLEKYQFSEKRDRAFFTRLVEGTLERQITIDYVADQFSKTKIRKRQSFSDLGNRRNSTALKPSRTLFRFLLNRCFLYRIHSWFVFTDFHPKIGKLIVLSKHRSIFSQKLPNILL